MLLINGKEYKINRKTAKVSEWDHIYCGLLKQIIEEGEIFENRTGIDTLSIEGSYFKLHPAESFPILESKKVIVKNAISEIQWIHQAQSNDVNWLKKRGNNIWNEWMIDSDGIYRIYEPATDNYDPDKVVQVNSLNGTPIADMQAKSLIPGRNIKEAKYYSREYAGTIGTAYGWINHKFKRPQNVLQQLHNNPHDRRMIISLWQDEYIKTATLPSCVWSTEWKVNGGKLNCFVHQRSCDTPLGLPFNVTQYAVLQAMFAKDAGLDVGSLNWSIMDTHIYVNQLEGIKKQLNRYKMMCEIEQLIASGSDEYIEKLYNDLANHVSLTEKYANTNNTALLEDIEKEKEYKMLLELMITKDKPELVLADKKFFDFSTEYTQDKEALKENPIGNPDIKLLKYKSAPFIKMPIAQ